MRANKIFADFGHPYFYRGTRKRVGSTRIRPEHVAEALEHLLLTGKRKIVWV